MSVLIKRRKFITGLFTSLGLLFSPKPKAKASETSYAFKDLFTNRVCRNNNRFYMKKSAFKENLYKEVGRLMQRDYHGYYIGEHDITLPIKKEYTHRELEDFFLLVRHRILSRYGSLYLPPNEKMEPIWFFRENCDRKNKFLRLELVCDFKK